MNATYKLVADGSIRYIGSTCKSLWARLKEHLSEARGSGRNHRLNWLRSLHQPPLIEIIEWTPLDGRAQSERYYISLARAYGCNLVNGTDGGDGTPGLRPSLETRRKMSLARRGHKRSAESIEKTAAARRGCKMSEANRTALLLANVGKKPSKETIFKRSVSLRVTLARKGPRKLSAETLEKMAVAQRGRKHSPEHIARAAAGRRKKALNGNN